MWMKFLSSIGWRCCRDTRRRNLILRERWPFLFSIAKSYQDNEKGREGQINYSTSVCTWCGGEGCKQWVSFCSVPPSSVLNIDLELASFKLVIYVTGDAKVIKKVLKEREGAWVANESTSAAVRITLTITTTLLVMLLHAYASPVVLAAAVSKDETTCTMCDECHDPCAVPSSPPPPSPVIKECPPPPAPPSPPPPSPPPPALPECPPPPQPPIQVLPPPCDVCGGTPSSSSPPPPGADVPSLLPDRPPLPPYVPGNPMAPPLYPTDIFSPPQRPYPSKSVHSRMHSSCSTLASIFVLFTASCFFFFF